MVGMKGGGGSVAAGVPSQSPSEEVPWVLRLLLQISTPQMPLGELKKKKMDLFPSFRMKWREDFAQSEE